jgi:DNA-binding response OmpR family regulator
VLATLMEAAPEPVPRDVLDAAARVGAATRGGRKRLVDQRVHTLRQKLGDDARRPRLIVSIVGIGYAFGKGAVAATG